MPGENIFLFVPNLIGYARIVFAIVAFYFMPCCPLTASSFYLLSGLLDAFDGHAARALNQGTRFGAMLDMLTDRCSTMCLLVNLALLYPRATLLFQLSMSLDVASHWLHLHSSVVRGSESHKLIDLSGNPVLRLYYTSRASVSACPVYPVCWERALLLPPLPVPFLRGTISWLRGSFPSGALDHRPCRGAQVSHQCGPPGHSCSQHGCPGRGGPSQEEMTPEPPAPGRPPALGSLAGPCGSPRPPGRAQAPVFLMCCPAC
ncbi:CDP-diacylglycerol--inositol 3-phosphatidyltransferase isoform X1 [Mustela erminea]|uniref:CDP-diacylglycerol--inositol 3-phosphatidyltransferase isoform X1 n=1 Tax=Mustela erminea TaxID=36723 RepID=UPI0013875342|nr:CDP-diacylglycerol--inositol 3-phosphatidyltransferase isoform X1 [Mustela erminea]